jgi:drug/metabolite transporter (DMT)-like permease
MIVILLWIVVFCISSSASIVLLGDRSLISGNLFNFQNIIQLLFNWKFILAMALAIFSRLSFIMINNALLKIPKLANISTSLCTLITSVSLIFVLLTNYYFLDEKLSGQQMIGAVTIIAGIAIMVK